MNNPRYCKDCGNYDLFKRNPAGDVYMVGEVRDKPDNGNGGNPDGIEIKEVQWLGWESWKCICGHKTLVQVLGNKEKAVSHG